MRYRYYICDVFTDTRFGGNPLAVLPNAVGLSSEQMQLIAREFHFSESTFVLPPEAGHTRRVRIFTPTMEVPFAGHPNVGTAFALASAGEFGPLTGPLTVTFEEKAGPVPVSIEKRTGNVIWCELSAPEQLSLGKTVPAVTLASAVSLGEADILTTRHLPQVASVGLPFLLAEVADRAALGRAAPVSDRFRELSGLGVPPDVLLYTLSSDDVDIRARVFAPLDGVPEDPATGSANCALAAMLTVQHPAPSGEFRWRIAQGVEMGRPSLLEARTRKVDGAVHTWIGGASVLVSEGELIVD